MEIEDSRGYLEFTCPECSSHKIEEIMVAMTVASEIRISEEEADETGPGGVFTNYGNQHRHGGHVDRYQCGECGYTILNHDSPLSEDGDAGALAKAIKTLNAVTLAPNVTLITHAELVQRFAAALEVMGGEALARIWNETSPRRVVYREDSMFEWVEE